MANHNYNSGRAFEYAVMRYFERQGFTVFRCAGSHSAVDVIVTGGVDTNILVQCKKERKRGSYKEDEESLRMLSVADNGWQKMLFIKRVNKDVLVKNVLTGAEAILPLASFR